MDCNTICWLSFIPICLLLRNFHHLMDDFRIENNPYNKYKIYHVQYDDKEYYYAKAVTTYLFWCIPVYVKYKIAEAAGFEDYRMELVEFESESEAVHELEIAYNLYRKKSKKPKINRIKNIKTN